MSGLGTTGSFPPVQEQSPNETEHRRQLARVVNRINGGKINVTGTVTLTPSDTATILTDPRIGYTSYVDIMPTTFNAAAAKQLYYIDTFKAGSCVIHHQSNAAVDQTFVYLVIG